VAEVTADTMRAQPDDALLAMARRSRGSPYLLAELLAGLREEQLVRVDSGQAGLLEARLPHRVSDTMRQRLNRLSEPSHGTRPALPRRLGSTSAQSISQRC
jgi:hypothetical protein